MSTTAKGNAQWVFQAAELSCSGARTRIGQRCRRVARMEHWHLADPLLVGKWPDRGVSLSEGEECHLQRLAVLHTYTSWARLCPLQ